MKFTQVLFFSLGSFVDDPALLYTTDVLSSYDSTVRFTLSLHSFGEVVEKKTTSDVNAQHSRKTFFECDAAHKGRGPAEK